MFTRDTHFVPLRHSLKSSERLRSVPGAASRTSLAQSPPRSREQKIEMNSASAPAGRARTVSPHGVPVGYVYHSHVGFDRAKTPLHFNIPMPYAHEAGYPMSVSPLRWEGAISTPATPATPMTAPTPATPLTTPMTSPMMRQRLCVSPCRTSWATPLIQRPAPVSPRAVEKLLAVRAPLRDVRFVAKEPSEATTPQATTPQVPTPAPRGVLRIPVGLELDKTPTPSRSPGQGIVPQSSGAVSLAVAANVAHQQLQAATLLNKARRLASPVGPSKQAPYGAFTPECGLGANVAKELGTGLSQQPVKVNVEPSSTTPGSERSHGHSTPEETMPREVRSSEANADEVVRPSLRIPLSEERHTSEPKEWWQVIAETRAWRQKQRAQQGWSQDVSIDG